MSSLADALRPLRGSQVEGEHSTLLHPVSRISFTLTDTDAFNKAVHIAVGWLGSKAGGKLPQEALELSTFDTRNLKGCHPCYAARVDDTQGSIWAARIDEPGSRPKSGEIWTTEIFVEKRENKPVRFGAQLKARQPVNAKSLSPSRPRLVYNLLEALSAEADGETISENISQISAGDIGNLVKLIYRPDRRLPIVAVSTDGQGRSKVDITKLTTRLSGAAHLITLPPEASWELTRSINKKMSTFGGAVRIYMPGVTEDEEDPYEHPIFFTSSEHRHRIIDILAKRVFPLGFRDGDGETRFWHLAQIRQAVSAIEARRKVGSEADQLRSEISALNDQVDELKESLETATALEKIAADNEKLALNLLEQEKGENERLRSTIYRLQQLNQGKEKSEETLTDRPLIDYDDLEEWAEEVLIPHISIHQKAIKDCRQNGSLDMLKRIESTLLVIRDYWIPYKIKGGLDRKNKAATELAALGVTDEPCFSRREKAREKPEYSVPYFDEKRVLYDHFKYGNSRNNAEQFRIYYSWDKDKKTLIIGKMPSHLTNDMS